MGFLDKNSRVIDFNFTEVGKQLYAKGELEFEYYQFFDDEIDYSQLEKNSSSLDETIDDTCIFEAFFVKDRIENNLQPKNALFAAESNYKNIPHITSKISDTEITVDQKFENNIYETVNSSLLNLPFKIVGDVVSDSKFLLSVFESGSNGLKKLSFKIDSNGNKMYDQYLVVSTDDSTKQFVEKIELEENRRKK